MRGGPAGGSTVVAKVASIQGDKTGVLVDAAGGVANGGLAFDVPISVAASFDSNRRGSNCCCAPTCALAASSVRSIATGPRSAITSTASKRRIKGHLGADCYAAVPYA